MTPAEIPDARSVADRAATVADCTRMTATPIGTLVGSVDKGLALLAWAAFTPHKDREKDSLSFASCVNLWLTVDGLTVPEVSRILRASLDSELIGSCRFPGDLVQRLQSLAAELKRRRAIDRQTAERRVKYGTWIYPPKRDGKAVGSADAKTLLGGIGRRV